jgi:rubrerythrin
MGGKVPAAPASASAVKGLTGLRGRRRILTFATELETMAIAAYYDAHAKLTDARLMQTGTAIMANEGQHLAMLRRALGRPPVPNAFETGKAGS